MIAAPLLLAGCDGGSDPAGPPVEPAEVRLLEAACAPDPENVLRASCTLRLDGPGLAEVEVTDGTETAVFASTVPSEAPQIPIWGLAADTSWTWTARTASGGDPITGELAVPALPEALRIDPRLTAEGASALVQLLVPLSCERGAAYAVVLDAAGRVRWYARLGGADVNMLQFTEAGTVLSAFDRGEVLELDLAGGSRFAWSAPLPIHHEVFRRNDRIFVLLADAYPADDGRTYVEDLVVALDGDGNEVWRWEQHDHLDATLAGGAPTGFWEAEFPGAIDAWHTNGMYVAEDEDLLLSLKKHDTLLRVSSDSGAIEWVLAGDGVGDPLPTDFAFEPGRADPRFHDQHHPALTADGQLTVFDNGNIRGLALELDEAAMSARFVAEWPLPSALSCPVQGSVFPLDGGHHVVTCASAAVIGEFGADGAPVGRFEPRCENGTRLPLMVRGQPVDLWGGWQAGDAIATRGR